MRRVAFVLFLGFVATIPLNAALSLGAAGSLNKWIGVAAGGAWVTQVFTVRGFRHLRPFHVAAVGFVVLGIASLTFWSDATGIPFVSLPLLAFMIVMLWDLCQSQKQLDSVLQAFVVGALASSMSLLYNYRLGVDIRGFETDVDLGVERRFAAAGTDPNELGVMLALSILFAFYLLAKASRGEWSLRWINGLAIPVGLFSIALTGSRTATVAAIPALIYGFVTLLGLSKRSRFVVVAALVIGVVAIQEYVPDVTLTRILESGERIAAGDFSSREVFWGEGVALFADHPLNGVGVGAFELHAPSGRAAHSVFVQTAAELGVLGLIALITSLAISLRSALILYRLGDRVWLFAILVWAAGALTLSWSYQKITWFVVGLAVIALELVGGPPQVRRRYLSPATISRQRAAILSQGAGAAQGGDPLGG